MVLIKEYRVPLPLTVEEYQVAQLFTVADMSKSETKGDTAVEILVNEPYDDSELGKGQYTHKIYHLGSRVPRWIAAICPSSALKLEEKAWNSYPYCRTVLTNGFLRDRFSLTVESWHKDDVLDLENVHELPPEKLKQREVIYVDISKTEHMDPKDVSSESDPTTFRSIKTNRGPLKDGWINQSKPRMCCYKLITIKFKVFGFETRVESFIAKTQLNMLLKFHRQLFCLIDQWFGLTMEDIRRLEDDAKRDLAQMLAKNTGLMSTSTIDTNVSTSTLESKEFSSEASRDNRVSASEVSARSSFATATAYLDPSFSIKSSPSNSSL
jgi:hypothetical protein